MAGSTTSGNKITFNNMRGTPLPLPLSVNVGPGEEAKLRLEMQMMAGMDGPHRFGFPVWIEREQQPMELYVQALFSQGT
jgi:hypothetical protein